MNSRSHQQDVDTWPRDESPEDFQTVERINRRQKANMPVASGRSADRSSKKTTGSRKAKKIVSQKSGGMHRRRQKRIQ